MEKETLYKFFDGKASRAEKEAVRTWLESSPENEQELFREREFFDAMILSGSMKAAGMEKKSRPFYRTALLEAIKIAAVFAITVACGTYFYKSEIRKIGEAMNTITVPTGQRANLTLPDGHYRLKAATYITRQPEAVKLYASLDNETMETANFNNNRATYDNALGIKEGTTTELDINVTGGRLYFGVKGVATVGGNGASWNADNFRLFYVGAPEDLAVTIGEHGVSTYYAPHTFTVADGLTAGVVKAATEEGKVTVDWCYEAGATVPTHTGVILKGAQGEYTCSFSAENVTADAENLLRGTLVDETINEAGFKYYKLSDGDNGLGFYWDSEDGTSIANKAGKAYLALPGEEVAKVNFFSWNLDATGVEAVESGMDEIVDVYALSGVCVRSQVKKSKALNGLQKGIYIINGKKIIK